MSLNSLRLLASKPLVRHFVYKIAPVAPSELVSGDLDARGVQRDNDQGIVLRLNPEGSLKRWATVIDKPAGLVVRALEPAARESTFNLRSRNRLCHPQRSQDPQPQRSNGVHFN
jgi:hypothetical protein